MLYIYLESAVFPRPLYFIRICLLSYVYFTANEQKEVSGKWAIDTLFQI